MTIYYFDGLSDNMLEDELAIAYNNLEDCEGSPMPDIVRLEEWIQQAQNELGRRHTRILWFILRGKRTFRYYSGGHFVKPPT